MADEFDFSRFAVGGAQRPDSFTGLSPQFRASLAQLLSSAPPEIQQQLRVASGYRSPDRQQQLWQQALAKYGSPEAARKWVAPPGRSKHNHGEAVDLKYLSPEATKWAHANARQFGLQFPLGNENWHIEPVGARGGQQSAPAAAGSMMAQSPAVSVPGAVLADSFAEPGIVASPQAGPPSGFGDLAMMFVQQQRARQDARAAEEQAAQVRRTALFNPDVVAGIYG